MGEGASRSGGCLCGAVRFDAVPETLEIDACHCGRCRRWSGGVFLSVPCGTSLDVRGGDALGVHRSSAYGERLFCRMCGSCIAWRMQDRSMSAVSLQAFDDQSGLVFAGEIFIDDKPPHYSFANETRKLTGAQVMAQFANEQGA